MVDPARAACYVALASKLGDLPSMLGVALDSDAESGCGLDEMYGDDVLTILEFENSNEDEE